MNILYTPCNHKIKKINIDILSLVLETRATCRWCASGRGVRSWCATLPPAPPRSDTSATLPQTSPQWRAAAAAARASQVSSELCTGSPLKWIKVLHEMVVNLKSLVLVYSRISCSYEMFIQYNVSKNLNFRFAFFFLLYIVYCIKYLSCILGSKFIV